MSSVGDTAAELFISKGIPYLAKKGTEAGRYYASEFMRDPKLQKKAINYAIKKATPVIQKVGSEALDQLSTKVRPNYKYKTDRMDLDADMYKGGAIDNFHMTKIEPSEIPEFVQKNELYLTKKKQIENMIKAWEQNKSVKLKFPIKQA